MTMTPMGAEDHVIGAQVGTHSRGNRFLANVRMASAVNEAALMRFDELLFGTANEQHLLIETQQVLRPQNRCRECQITHLVVLLGLTRSAATITPPAM
jgi:hypothetical protein